MKKYKDKTYQYPPKTFGILIYGLMALLTLNGISSYSQSTINPRDYINYNEVIGKSPTAAQFLRYDELPVSEYTGVPSITIPLYNIEVDNIKVPLTLSYHAGGLKVTQEASWVGLGWDIPAVASVTQIVKDENDLLLYDLYGGKAANDFYPDWRSNGAGGYSSYLWENGWTMGQLDNVTLPKAEITKQYGYMVSTAGWIVLNERYVQKYEELTNYVKDSEPDIFKINIQGETLNCIIDRRLSNAPSFLILNKEGYIIKYNKNSGWEIIDPHGIKYYLATKSEQHNLSMNRTYNMQSAVWYVNRIVSTKGKEIKFSYLQSGTYTNNYKTNTKTIQVISTPSELSNVNSVPPGIIDVDISLNGHPAFNSRYGAGSQREYTIEEQQIYLQSIEFPWGKVEFTLSSRTDISGKKKLDAIIVKNNRDEQVKKASFSYTYYSGNDTWSKKLKLNSVQIAGEAPYRFTYDAQILPVMNSYATDYWGYYNGNANNKSLAPNPLRWKTKMPNMLDAFSILNENSEPEVTQNNHSARIQYAKAGILEKIEYPTGGKTMFEYELNQFTNHWVPDYDSLTNVISKGNGIRIKNIKYLDSDDRILKQEQYSYQGGKTMHPIIFFQSVAYNLVFSSAITAYQTHQSTSIAATRVTVLQCSNSGNYADNPLSSFGGIGYDRVTKTTIGQNNNGQVVTFYHNTPDMTGPITTRAYGGSPILSLPSIKNSNKPINGLLYKRIYYNTSGDKISQEEFQYSNTNLVSFPYSKPNLHYGIKISGYNTILQEYGPNYQNINEIVSIGRHVLGFYPIFDFESLLTKKTNTQYNGNDSIVTTEEHTYNTINNYNIYDYNNFLKSTLKYDSFGYSNNWFYKYPQDSTKNPIYKDMVNQNILSPIIEQYEINYKGNTINTKKTNYDIFNNLYLIKSIQSRRAYFDDFTTEIAFNQYDRMGNIRQITTLDGISSVYLWSYNYQYPIAEIKNATYTQVRDALGGQTVVDNIAKSAVLSDADKAKINNLRTNAGLAGAHVTTYTYKPLVGILTATDPAGLTTTYEYDTFGRLIRIKDPAGKIIQSYNYHYQNQ